MRGGSLRALLGRAVYVRISHDNVELCATLQCLTIQCARVRGAAGTSTSTRPYLVVIEWYISSSAMGKISVASVFHHGAVLACLLSPSRLALQAPGACG